MASTRGFHTFMYGKIVVFVFLVLSAVFTETRCSSERSDNPCPCKAPSLCDVINTWPKKEVCLHVFSAWLLSVHALVYLSVHSVYTLCVNIILNDD